MLFKFSFFFISISLFPNDLIFNCRDVTQLNESAFVNKFIVVYENDSKFDFSAKPISPDLCLLIFILIVLNSIMQKYVNILYEYDKSLLKFKILILTS